MLKLTDHGMICTSIYIYIYIYICICIFCSKVLRGPELARLTTIGPNVRRHVDDHPDNINLTCGQHW